MWWCTATLRCKIRLIMQKNWRKLKQALMKMKKHRDANERAKNSTNNETHLNSYKETNHKDMIERTISLINVRKKEKKWITEKFLHLDLKIDSWWKSMNPRRRWSVPRNYRKKIYTLLKCYFYFTLCYSSAKENNISVSLKPDFNTSTWIRLNCKK